MRYHQPWYRRFNDNLEEWQCRPSLVQFADKPVKRFLTYGGKAAQNLLERCLDMAREIIDGGVTADASDVGIPARVVSRFQEWWQSRTSGSHHRGRATKWAFRYRPAEIRLDLGCVGTARSDAAPNAVGRTASRATHTVLGCQPATELLRRREACNINETLCVRLDGECWRQLASKPTEHLDLNATE